MEQARARQAFLELAKRAAHGPGGSEFIDTNAVLSYISQFFVSSWLHTPYSRATT